MPEGDAHRELVRLLSKRLAGDATTNWATFIDGVGILDREGIPPMLDACRPDIYAVERGSGRTIIGEAKTAKDIDNDHTKFQLEAYFRHISDGPGGELWMAVPMLSAGTAHRMCRVTRDGMGLKDVRFTITGWLFGRTPIGECWHG